MRCTIKGLSLAVALLVAGCLAAGCGGAAQSAIGSVASSVASKTTAISAIADATAAQADTPAPAAADTPTPAPADTPTPTTAPPTTTSAPPSTDTTTVTTTAAPSTATTTVTTTAAAPTPTASPTASGSGSGTSLIWLWVLLGVLVLAGLIYLIARSGRRRSAAAAGWRSKLIDVYAKGSALHDAMSSAEMQGDLTASRWYDIQRRADDLAQTLYALQESATDPGDQARIADVLASLQAVRSAMDAERAPGGAGPQQADVVRSRLYTFESSLRALRGGDAGDQEFS